MIYSLRRYNSVISDDFLRLINHKSFDLCFFRKEALMCRYLISSLTRCPGFITVTVFVFRRRRLGGGALSARLCGTTQIRNNAEAVFPSTMRASVVPERIQKHMSRFERQSPLAATVITTSEQRRKSRDIAGGPVWRDGSAANDVERRSCPAH